MANGDFGTLFGCRKRVIEVLQHLEEEFSLVYFDISLTKELERIIKVVYYYEDFSFADRIFVNSLKQIKGLFDKLNKRLGIIETDERYI